MGTTDNLTRPSRAALSPSKEALLRKRLQGGIQTLQHGGPAAQIQAREQQGPARLSFAQQRLWFLHELDPQSSAYNETTALRITGSLDVDAFDEALNRIHERHTVLSARFPAADGLPMQVCRPARIRCELADVQHVPASQREAAATELAQKEVSISFDLAEGPVTRYLLIRCKPDEHLFVVVMHHIVTDGWSVALFFQELAALYDVARRGVPPELRALPIQYSDFAEWQRETLRGDALANELRYWKGKLAGAPPTIDLPTDREERAAGAHGAVQTLQLPRDFCETLATESHTHNATEFMMLAAALAITLHRWTGQEDLVFGTVAAGRTRRETESLIGCFMNFLPIRVRVAQGVKAGELTAQVRATVLEAYSHQDCPFDKIVEAINPARGVHRNPLYNVALLLQNFPTRTLQSDTLNAELVPIDTNASLLDLRFIAEHNDAGMRVACEYDTALFDRSTIETLLDAFDKTLHRLVESPESVASEIDIPQPLVIQATASRAWREVENITVAATFTADPVQDSLLYWMQEVEITAKISFALYNQVFQQLLDPASALNQNRRGLNVILLRVQDWLADPVNRAAANLAQTVRDFSAAMSAAAARSAVPWLVCFCPIDEADPEIKALEDGLVGELERMPGIYVLTTNDVLSWYPVETVFDTSAERLGNVPYTPLFFAALGTAIVRTVHALKRPPRKVIALDCDNTLWEGVCGEDGAHGIGLKPERRALQEFMNRQSEAGMLLCLCTKNTESDVAEVFRCRSDFPLRQESFVAAKVNWRPKSENIKELANELNLGPDSFIFVDDNPMECAEVEANCPGVIALRLPDDPERIPSFLEHAWIFDHLKVTDEDKKRARSYHENRQREELRAQCVSMAEFLEGLNLSIVVEPAQPAQFSRVSQLTQRTNQFNFTTRRYSEAEIQKFSAQRDTRLFAVSVKDRFGDYGLVGVMLARLGTESVDVDTFLLSCRVLGKGVEHRMISHLGDLARTHGLSRVDLHFRPSARNRPASDFLEKVAASFRRANGDGSVFSLPARIAARMRYEPENVAPPPVSSNGEKKPAMSAIAHFRNCGEIALHTHNPAWILATVEAWSRANRLPVCSTGPYVGPRTHTERELCRIWAELLGVERVGIQDDFFALGGSSLLAVRVFAQIEKSLGQALPLVVLFQSPTIEQLAHVLEQRKGHASSTSIVPIQTAGSRPPLILVHGAGGGILWGYANLSTHLGQDQPVYAIEPRLIGGAGERLTVEHMAQQYLTHLRAFQPRGPYYIGGYCFGGYVAYEIARLLREENETVALLALIDSAAPNGSYNRIPWWNPFYYLRFIQNTCSWLSDFMKLESRVRWQFITRKLGVFKRKLSGERGGGKESSVDLHEYIDPTQFPDEEIKLWQAHLNAGSAYKPRPLRGRVTLLRTRTQPFFCSFDPEYGWGEVADGVEVRRVPGSHEAIFIEPHVRALAAQVAACCRQARAGSE